MQESFSIIDRCRVPVIAVVQGGCIGGGVDLVTACDIRIATENAYFTIQEVNIAIVADVGTLQRIPHLLPQGLVRELAYTGRKFPRPKRAAMASSTRSRKTMARRWRLPISWRAPSPANRRWSITGIKQVLNVGRDQSIEQGLEYVAVWNAGMLQGGDVGNAVQGPDGHAKTPVFDDLQA